jgi:hypothetical protein
VAGQIEHCDSTRGPKGNVHDVLINDRSARSEHTSAVIDLTVAYNPGNQ